MLELFLPGSVIFGISGALLVALGFLTTGELHLNWYGILLISLGLLLFYLELKVLGRGVLGITGIVCFITGSILFFGGAFPISPNNSREGLNIWIVVVVSVGLFGLLWFLIHDLRKAGQTIQHVPSVDSSAVGQKGITTSDLSPYGTVRVLGENWSAVSYTGEVITSGRSVYVEDSEGILLRVSVLVRLVFIHSSPSIPTTISL